MKYFIPILSWLPKYKGTDLRGDAMAGITVGVLLIPQGMSYAMIAELPAIYGLYTALIPQLIYALFGTSRQLAIGPVALDSLLVASGLAVIATAGTGAYLLLASLLALVVGAVQFTLGMFKMGFLANFLSKPVINGFTSAAALIIGLNQIKYLAGIDIDSSMKVHELMGNMMAKIGDFHPLTLVLGLFCLVALLLMKRLHKQIPSGLILLVVTILVMYFTGWEKQGVSVIGDIPAGLPSFNFPTLEWETIVQLLPMAVTIALIGFTQAISLSRKMEERHPEYSVDSNQELRALGIMNMISSMFQSYPATGSFSRTAVNDDAGARTNLAGVFSMLVVGLVLLFLTPLFYSLPHAALAALIIVAVFSLIDFSYPKELFNNNKDEFFLLIGTFCLTAFFGIIVGICSGAVLALLILVYRTARPHVAVLGQINGHYKNLNRFPESVQRADVLAVRFDGQLYYGNMAYFEKTLNRLITEKGQVLRLVVLNAEGISYIDASAGENLAKMIHQFSELNIDFRLAGAIGPVRDALKKRGLNELIGEDHYFIKTSDAIDHFDHPNKANSSSIASQANE